MIGGIAVVNDDDLATRLQFIHNAAGAVPGPFDAWLALRGTKTLHLRMPRHDENGRTIAAWLAERLGDERVIYPGLPSHPQHELAKKQMSGFGGMISVELGTKERAHEVLEPLPPLLARRVARRRREPHQPPGVDDPRQRPASSAAASSASPKGSIRLCCGVEDVDDLIGDLEHAFHVV